MIKRIDLIFLFNVLIIIDVNAYNITLVNKSPINKNQYHFGSIKSPQNRGARGIFYNDPYYEHEFHESVLEPIHEPIHHEPIHIVKVVAPPKRRDGGVKELLLVLAPLAAIPLIGSFALTTFTTLFATQGLGRRKRDLLTRELLSRTFTEVHPKAGDYSSFGAQHNVGLESLLASTASTGSFAADTNPNEKRHTFAAHDVIHTKSDRFGPKSQLIGVRIEDRNNWRPIDTNGNSRTGVRKSSSVVSAMLNTSAQSVESMANKSNETLVKGFGERYQQMISNSDLNSGKGVERVTALGAQLARVEPIHKHQHNTPLQQSAYRSKTDFNDNTSNESLYYRKSDQNRVLDNTYKNYRDMSSGRSSGPSTLRFADLTPNGSENIVKRMDTQSTDKITNSNDNNKPKTDDFEFNSWIPFLSNPYLRDAVRGEGRREIQELDVIQKYLNTMGRPDYNDEIIATYLSCNGMLSASNQCLERLTCQFSDTTSALKQIEKDVSALVIYSLLKNNNIDNGFKSRLQKAAFFGRDSPGKCHFYNCPKNTFTRNQKKKR